jgi:hypothetical protein
MTFSAICRGRHRLCPLPQEFEDQPDRVAAPSDLGHRKRLGPDDGGIVIAAPDFRFRMAECGAGHAAEVQAVRFAYW